MTTRWVFAGLALLVLLLLLPIPFAFDLIPGVAPDKSTLATVSYAKPPAGGSMSVALEPPPGEVRPWEIVSLAMILTDSGASAVAVRQLTSTGDCLELVQPIATPFTIPAHSSVRLSPEFRAACESGQFPLTLLLRWDEVPGASYEGFVTTTPIPVRSKSAVAWPRYFKIVSGILRDFSWPILLLALGAWIQARVAARDNRVRREREDKERSLKSEQDARDRQLKDEQDARDSRNHILGTLLPHFIGLVLEHYTPMARRIDTAIHETGEHLKAIRGRMDAGSSGDGVLADRALCSVLLLRARFLQLFLSKGGVYFGSSLGEELFAACSDGYLQHCRNALGRDEFEQGAALLREHTEDTIISALQVCRSEAFFSDTLVQRFSDWARSDPDRYRQFRELMSVMSGVLAFECNRPFYQVGNTGSAANISRNWYVDPPKVGLKPEDFNVEPEVCQLLKQWYLGIPVECRIAPTNT